MLLDLSLPAPGGIETTQRVKREVPSAGIIALAVNEDEDQLFEAIKAGAAAFILKDIGPDDLVTIIRRVNGGEYLINDKVFARPSVANRVLKEFRELAVYGQEAAPIFAPLSPREVEILDNIAKGMTNKQVAYALSISEQTVKNHMSSILRKLSVNDRTQAVVYAMKQGWIRTPRIERSVATSARPRTSDRPRLRSPGTSAVPATRHRSAGPAARAAAVRHATGSGGASCRADRVRMGPPGPGRARWCRHRSPDRLRPASPPRGPGATGVTAIRAELEVDIRRIEEENAEIDMLMEQVLIEIERHEARRAKIEERLASLEAERRRRPGRSSGGARQHPDARPRRSMLFDAQRQVLEGKQRVLARFLQRIVEIDNSLASVTGGLPARPAPAGPGLRPLATAARPQSSAGDPSRCSGCAARKTFGATSSASCTTARRRASPTSRSRARSWSGSCDAVRRAWPRRAGRAAPDGPAGASTRPRSSSSRSADGPRRPRARAHVAPRRAGPGAALGHRRRLRFARHRAPPRARPRERALPQHRRGHRRATSPCEPPSVVVRLDWSEQELAATIEGTWPRARADDDDDAGLATDRVLGDAAGAARDDGGEARAGARGAHGRTLPAGRAARRDRRTGARPRHWPSRVREEGQVIELVAPRRSKA